MLDQRQALLVEDLERGELPGQERDALDVGVEPCRLAAGSTAGRPCWAGSATCPQPTSLTSGRSSIAIGVSIVLTIVGSILAGIGSGISAELHGRSASGDLGSDERDKQISRRGDRIGFSVFRRHGRRARPDDAGV